MENWFRLQVLHVFSCFFFISLGWALADSVGVPSIAYATAATRIVSTSGVDTGDCIASPCKTIQFAINVASPGDTILVSPGTYNENILVTKPDLTLQGSGASSTIISGDTTANVVYAFEITSFTIEGFTVTNAGQTGSVPGSAGIHLNPNGAGAIGNWIVRKNILQNNGFGLALWNSLAGGDAIIENNLIVNNSFSGIANDGHPHVTIKNNTIANNGWFGYEESVGLADNTIVNNIIASNGFTFPGTCSSTGILVGPAGTYYIAFNDVFNNAHGNYGQNPGTGSCLAFVPSPGTGEISADPRFEGGTYTLLPGSPAVDAIPWGTNGCGTTLISDQRGQARPQPVGGACDIGAYEVAVAGQPLSAWVTGFSPHTAVCKNVTTGHEVTLSDPVSPWDCEAVGLGVTAGDQVALRVRGPVKTGTTDVGGAVVGMVPGSGGCTNLTTGQQVTFQHMRGATAVSCVAAGLVVHPKDAVQIRAQGAAE